MLGKIACLYGELTCDELLRSNASAAESIGQHMHVVRGEGCLAHRQEVLTRLRRYHMRRTVAVVAMARHNGLAHFEEFRLQSDRVKYDVLFSILRQCFAC